MTGRRAAAASLLALVASASLASADPLVPSFHESTSAVRVPSAIHAVVVDVDAGAVRVTSGVPRGTVHKRWDLQEPTVTSTVKDGVLRLVGRCKENQVAIGGVVFVGVPTEPCAVDVTLAVPAGVSVDLQGDSVSASGTRGATKVRAIGAVDLARLGPGPLDALSYGDTVALRNSRPASTRLRANNTVTVVGVTTGTLTATSDSGDASLASVTGRDVDVDATGTVSATTVRARSLTVRSYSGSSSLRDVMSAGVLRAEGNDGLSLTRVHAGSADLSSPSGGIGLTSVRAHRAVTVKGNHTVTVTDLGAQSVAITSYTSGATVRSSRVTGRLAVEVVNAILLDGVRAGSARLRSYSGGLQVRNAAVPVISGTATDTVSVALTQVPSSVALESSTSSLALAIPRSSYAVKAESARGRVTLRGIDVDAAAPRHLDLRADDDITVN